MKRLLSFTLALTMLCSIVLTGCGSHPGTTVPKSDAITILGGASTSTSPEATPLPQPIARVQQYGSATSMVTLDAPLNVRVNYPKGDIEVLDTALADWATKTAADLRLELEGSHAKSNAIFSAGYDSFEVKNRFVSVHLSGTLSSSHDARPEPLGVTFSADRKTGEMLTLESLMVDPNSSALRDLVIERAGDAELGDDPLSQWVLTEEGMRFYLPDQSSVDLTYQDLAGIILLPSQVNTGSIDPNKPMVALTFDDGPYSKVTDRLLDLLDQYHGKATFFVVGNRVSTYADSVRRAVEAGHEIGIHTWEHKYLTGLDEAGIMRQIDLTQDALQDAAGYTSAVIRPPGGKFNDFVSEVGAKHGYYFANWSVDTEDWKSRNADSVYQQAMSQVRNGSIILCHDLYPTTADAMERVIPELVAQGYQLVTVSELLSFREGGIVPGKLYLNQ